MVSKIDHLGIENIPFCSILIAMRFEYDPAKSAANREKHGIDFKDAQALWDDDRLLEAPARTVDEPRVLVIGMIGSKYWTAVCTYRGETIRIISVRRARAEEVSYYESI